MKLLAIETPEKNNRLKQILITLKNNHDIHLVSFWTSGTLSTGNQWYWTSINQPFQYTDWVPSVSSTQLNNNVCVRLWGRHNFQWHNHDCEDKLNFICETNGDRSNGEDLKDTEESDYDNDELMTTAPLITINIPDNELEKTNLVTIDDLSQELEPSTESYQDIFQRPETIELTTHKPQLFDDVPTLPFNRFKLRFVLDHLVDWETAKRICNQQGMEIAILGSEYELRIINAFLRNKGE